MTFKFEPRDVVFWITKEGDKEVVKFGEIFSRSGFVEEVDVNVRVLVPSNRYRIKMIDATDAPSGFDIYHQKNKNFMEISESRLFASKQEALDNIEEWAT